MNTLEFYKETITFLESTIIYLTKAINFLKNFTNSYSSNINTTTSTVSLTKKLTNNFILAEFLIVEPARFRQAFKQEPDYAAIYGTKQAVIPLKFVSNTTIENLTRVASHLEMIRQKLSEQYKKEISIMITSGYRPPEYNRLVPNSSPTSLHQKGLAADFITKPKISQYSIQSQFKNTKNIKEFLAYDLGHNHIGIEP